MSEYQYYEFLAIDRPLSAKQIEAVQKFSSRAEISANRFVNEYHWGDFRGDVDYFLTHWFDLMVYVANWGTQRLALSLPPGSIDRNRFEQYGVEATLEMRGGEDHIILDFCSDTEDPDGWPDGSRWTASLAPIREELLSGDERALFLGWLAGAAEEWDEGDKPPPVPPGLSQLTCAQKALVEFLRIDPDLLTIAAQDSPSVHSPPDQLDDWIRQLPQGEKNQMLIDAARGDHSNIGPLLKRRYQAAHRSRGAAATPSDTIGTWMRRAEELRAQREQAEREAAARRRAKREAEAQAKGEAHLNALAPRQQQAWNDIERLIGSKQAASYDEAVKLLCDLREIASREQLLDRFTSRMKILEETHQRKVSFIKKLHAGRLT